MNAIQQKKRVVVICPGRGTYNKEDLGYLQRLHPDKVEFVANIDAYRKQQGQVSIQSLDQADQFNMRTHTAGENASALIYACAIADFQAINRDKYEVVAVTGNSMGWYIALAAAGALDAMAAIELINTMGSMMVKGVIGGQMIYPISDENWRVDQKMLDTTERVLIDINSKSGCEVYVSIKLGGYVVFGGNKKGLKALEQALEKVQDRYPMNLFNHAAFHTPLLNEISVKAKALLAPSLFKAPHVPLIDGLGQIWQPYSCDPQSLYDYTLGTQVVDTYNFTKAIEVSIKEFSPDKLIVLGPGATLGGAVAQSLIQQKWLDLNNKQDFIALQKTDPFILAMGLEGQRKLVM
ncbi:ACP S-malonyltransferase [Glaciecola sp. SC05]|uniref:ACP S-malonyltransferase n=1 Tax=Glaciecola sp. SC05 TaxID=1987355 RepID=UPI003529613C